MAKGIAKPKELTFVQIVMGAEAEVIKSAYEARVKIDELLHQREEAYQQIQALEEQVDDVMGDVGVYVFPPPPCPVAGTPAGGRSKKSKPASKTATKVNKLPAPSGDSASTTSDAPVVESAPTPNTMEESPPADSANNDNPEQAEKKPVSEQEAADLCPPPTPEP